MEFSKLLSNSNSNLTNDSKFNGRLFFPENENAVENMNNFNTSNLSKVNSMLSNKIQENELSINYFHINNINNLQNKIKENVRVTANYDIGRQDDNQLLIIMRSIYLTHSKNLSYNIQQQINDLNKLVIDEAVKQIIPNIKQYLHYINDISKPRHIISHPTNVSDGNNSLSLFRSI